MAFPLKAFLSMTFLYEAFPCEAFQIDGHQIFYDFGVLSHDFFLYHVHDYEFWKGINLIIY